MKKIVSYKNNEHEISLLLKDIEKVLAEGSAHSTDQEIIRLENIFVVSK